MDLLKRIKEDILLKNIIIALLLIVVVAVVINISLAVVTRHGQRHAVPSFTNMTIEQAIEASKEIELELEIIDSLYVASKTRGVILDQYPKAGNFVKKGRRVFLTTNSFKAKMVPIPYVAGFSLRQAKNKITGSGFEIQNITYKEDLATNNVLKQYYKGKQVRASNSVIGEVGSSISLVVGLNPVDPNPTVPLIIGLSLRAAKNKLWESGFNLGVIEYNDNIEAGDKDNSNVKIERQSLIGGTVAMYGRSISITLATDSNKIAKSLSESGEALALYNYKQMLLDSVKLATDSISITSDKQ